MQFANISTYISTMRAISKRKKNKSVIWIQTQKSRVAHTREIPMKLTSAGRSRLGSVRLEQNGMCGAEQKAGPGCGAEATEELGGATEIEDLAESPAREMLRRGIFTGVCLPRFHLGLCCNFAEIIMGRWRGSGSTSFTAS